MSESKSSKSAMSDGADGADPSPSPSKPSRHAPSSASSSATAGVSGEAEPHRLSCMEVWGGNEARQTSLTTPGLDVWVLSKPYHDEQAGGDLYYGSLCGAGRIARIALADVSGHGQEVSRLSADLRKLMRKYIGTPNQTRFARQLNAELSDASEAGKFATALLCTYFAPTDQLVVVNAGHPRPLWYSREQNAWRVLTPELLEQTSRQAPHTPRNLPLGVIGDSEYAQYVLSLAPGDLVLLYTDAVTEAQTPQGDWLGEEGLLQLVNQLDPDQPERMLDRLVSSLTEFRRRRDAEDDLTLILLHHNAEDPPKQSLSEKLVVLARMIGIG